METTVRSFHRVNGSPIKLYDEEIDEMITMDTHPVFGFDYYVIITSKYVISDTGCVSQFIGREMEIISPSDFALRQANDSIFEGCSMHYNPKTEKFDIVPLSKSLWVKPFYFFVLQVLQPLRSSFPHDAHKKPLHDLHLPRVIVSGG